MGARAEAGLEGRPVQVPEALVEGRRVDGEAQVEGGRVREAALRLGLEEGLDAGVDAGLGAAALHGAALAAAARRHRGLLDPALLPTAARVPWEAEDREGDVRIGSCADQIAMRHL